MRDRHEKVSNDGLDPLRCGDPSGQQRCFSRSTPWSPVAMAHFDAMDTNNDGKISRDEHAAMCEKRFQAMDTNNDGFMTREEARIAWRERKEKIKEKIKKRHSHGQPAPLPSQMTPEESEGSSH